MKKAKIVLSAVAMFALIGGALAFKAQRFGAGNLFYTTSSVVEDGQTIYYCTTAKNYSTTLAGGFITPIAYPSTVLVDAQTVCTGNPSLNVRVTTVAN